ncbi:hypothetical protein protein, putative [Babesia ovis]|uniref:Uncharacterized protein n=1 Tax=Babesia ovis TaxID=5869 RepID=A0A9W5TAB5_BABOV|nr:hypothetical protein protein, putative [Babesia ovis]
MACDLFKSSISKSIMALCVAITSLSIVQGLRLNYILDGAVYERSVTGDLCSIIAGADSAIVKSTLPFSSIEIVPEHWALYVHGISLPVTDCENNEAELESIELMDDDYVYIFRSEAAYQDPMYAAEYMKVFSKNFGDRIKPPKKSPEATKKLAKNKSSKKRKNRSSGSEDVSALVGLIAKSLLSGNLAKAFGMDNTIDAVANNTSGESTSVSPQDNENKGAWNLDLLADIVGSLGQAQATPEQTEVKPNINDDL